jgi:hypothetical protein
MPHIREISHIFTKNWQGCKYEEMAISSEIEPFYLKFIPELMFNLVAQLVKTGKENQS